MPRGRPIEPVVLTDDEKDQLLSLANSRSLPHGVVRRAQIVLACAQGEANASIARRMRLTMPPLASGGSAIACKGSRGCTMNCARAGPEPMTMNGSPRSSTPRSRPNHPMAPPIGACRGRAKRRLQEHRATLVQSVRHPTPPPALLQALQRPLLRREGARYRRPLSQPARPRRRAVVDEKTQVQALNRTQPNGAGLRRRGHPRTSVTAPPPCSPPSTSPPDRHHPVQEAPSPPGVSRLPTPHRRQRPRTVHVHLIADNYATHKHPKVRAWLARRPRYHIHYTPTMPRGSTRSSAGSASSLKRPFDAARSPTSANW